MGEMFNPDRVCPRCMEENRNLQEVCPHCGFYLPGYQSLDHHLPLYTILKGRYLLGAVLGEGGFGITYSAWDLVYQRHVAIKELFIAGVMYRRNEQVVLTDNSRETEKYCEECRGKFLQEANVLQSLQDKDGVVDIYEYFQENHTAYIVMEYLDGVDLRTFLKERGGKISYANAYRFLRPIMKSLIEIHRGGIIHRDISPDNIRYLSNKKMKLMDFGSAKSVAAETSSSVIVLFKPGYTPPEQYASGYMVGPWMDVYAMAATIYRCITGKTPKNSIERKNDGDIETPRSLGADISPKVERVILKGMALEPANRFLDMRAFYQELKAVSPDGASAGRAVSGKTAPGKAASEMAAGNSSRKEPTPVVMDEGYRELLSRINGEKISLAWIYGVAAIEICLILIGVFLFLQYR